MGPEKSQYLWGKWKKLSKRRGIIYLKKGQTKLSPDKESEKIS